LPFKCNMQRYSVVQEDAEEGSMDLLDMATMNRG
jgi:hypothetical protein